MPLRISPKAINLATILCLGFVTLWLRLVNLGYSDYQGDEIKALATPASGQSLVDFLLEQRKGPTQFVISYLMQKVYPALDNEFFTRLPFALAGIIAIGVFYLLVEMHFGKRIALTAALLLSINGLLVGLSRIVQYQSFVILFSLLTLYFFSLAGQSRRWQVIGIYLGMVCWATALLTHYDGIFIAPMAIYLLARWFRSKNDLPGSARLKHLILPALLAIALLAMFYGPYLVALSGSTLGYFSLRIAGEGDGAGTPSSLFTFKLYNPLLATVVYLVFGALSLFRIRKLWSVWLWFLFPWFILEVLLADPGTHIYTYVIPATILVAEGIEICASFAGRWIKNQKGESLVYAGVAVILVFLALISHLIFIDHSPEYPWEERRILFWTVGKPDPEYRMWVFGFPYNRQWEAIGEYVSSQAGTGYYATNENKSIAEYFVPYPFDINRAGYYIHIYHPQSFRDKLADDKIRYWMKNYAPMKTIQNQGKVLAEIYLMPAGNVDEIRKMGY
jgi:Dolichyl-phosphate-mannose-protein mannosyltransferase